MASVADILERSRTVAVVGASRDPAKPGNYVPALLQRAGYRVIPVNPSAEVILGERAHPDLASVPEPIDVVDVFRPAADAPGIAHAAVAAGAKTLWLQSGIVSEEAQRIAEDAGLDFVQDLCMGEELAALGR